MLTNGTGAIIQLFSHKTCFWCDLSSMAIFLSYNKNALQWDAYRPLVDLIPVCTAEGRVCIPACTGQGGVCLGGCLPGGVCLRVAAREVSTQEVYRRVFLHRECLPREGVCLEGVCLGFVCPGDVCQGVSAQGVSARGVADIPSCEQNDWQTGVKNIACLITSLN